MTLLLSLADADSAAGAARYLIAGNRNRVPTGFALSGSSNVMKYDGAWHVAPKDTGLSAVRAFFENRYAQANGPNSATSLVAFNLQASVEYVIASSGTTGLVPLTFSAADQRAFAPGDGVWSDWATITIPAGAAYRVRTDREHTGTSGTYNQLNNILMSPTTTPGKIDHASSGTDSTVHKSRGDGGTYSAIGSTTTTNTYTATCVQGVPSVPGTKSVLLVGDSILRGTGDTRASAPVQQGDWLNGTSPAAPYLNYGNIGWAETSIGDAYPYFSMAVPSKAVVSSSFNATNLGPQFDVIKDSPPTHAVLAVGVNDLMAGRTAAQVEADLILAVALIKSRYPNALVYVATVTPVTNTSDAWATTANQTFTGTLTGGTTTVTWGNFSGTDDTTGRRLLNARIRAGNVTGADGYVDVAAACQDATDPRKWRADLGTPTTDGIHPQAVLHRQMADDADLDWLVGLGGAFTPAGLPNAALWLDPGYGVYQETTGPATPCGDNDPVGTWVARTGQAFAAPNDAARPTYKANAGKPYLLFDGVDDLLMLADLDLTGNAGISAAVNARLTGSQSYPIIFAPRSPNFVSNYFEIRGVAGGDSLEFANSTGSYGNGAVSTDVTRSAIATYAAGAAKFYVDNVLVSSGTGTDYPPQSTAGAYVGNRSPGFVYPFAGRLGDVVCTKEALTATGVTQLTTFLAARKP